MNSTTPTRIRRFNPETHNVYAAIFDIHYPISPQSNLKKQSDFYRNEQYRYFPVNQLDIKKDLHKLLRLF